MGHRCSTIAIVKSDESVSLNQFRKNKRLDDSSGKVLYNFQQVRKALTVAIFICSTTRKTSSFPPFVSGSSNFSPPSLRGGVRYCFVSTRPSPCSAINSSRTVSSTENSVLEELCCFHFRRKNYHDSCAIARSTKKNALHLTLSKKDETIRMDNPTEITVDDDTSATEFPCSNAPSVTFSSSGTSNAVEREGRRIHYNDALLNRILKGRDSSSWRRRTRRAAATLGLNLNHQRFRRSICSGSTSASTSGIKSIDDAIERASTSNGMLRSNRENKPKVSRAHDISISKARSKKNTQYQEHPIKPVERAVPPLSSNILRASNTLNPAIRNKYAVEDDTISNVQKRFRRKLQRKNLTQNESTNQKLTDEEYQRAKLQWAAKYTSLSTLRSTFGTNRNKLWGDFDAVTTRKLYHTLLPRALLGLYEMGLWSPTDLAPLAYEARIAAKRYARERCVVPGRLMAMVYDGFRSWRDWGTFNTEGMSWEQIWYKYETQILDELLITSADGNKEEKIEEQDFHEEITAQICLRILERSCITNEAVDKLILNDEIQHANDGSNEQKKLGNSENDIAHIAAKLESDMQELLNVKHTPRKDNRGWNKYYFPNSKGFCPSVKIDKDSRPEFELGMVGKTVIATTAQLLFEDQYLSLQNDSNRVLTASQVSRLRLLARGKKKYQVLTDFITPSTITEGNELNSSSMSTDEAMFKSAIFTVQNEKIWNKRGDVLPDHRN